MVNAASGGERDKLVEGGTERVGSRAGAVRVLAQVAAEAAAAKAAKAVVVAGDLVNSWNSASQISSFKQVWPARFASPVHLVPGNHDVDRSRVSRRFVLDIPDASAAEEFFSEREDMAVALRRFKPFLQFHQRVFKSTLDADAPLPVRRLTIGSLTIGLIGLNTAWLAHEADHGGKLVVGRRLLTEALEQLEARSPDLILAIGHHPPSAWAPFERTLIEPLLSRC